MANLLGLLGYIDPSSGSLAMQVLIAAVLSAGVVLRHYLLRPVAWVLRFTRAHRRSQDEIRD